MRFAESQGVAKQQVTQWIAKGFIVDEWTLYSPRRQLVVPGKNLKKAKPLKAFIDRNHGAQKSKFASAEGVAPAQVTQWVAGGYIVQGGTLYSPRRVLNKLTELQ